LPRESTISLSSSVLVAHFSVSPKLDCQLATILARQSSRCCNCCTENENGRQRILPAVLVHLYRYGMNLPVPAAVTAPTMEATTCCSVANCAATETTANRSACHR